MMETNGKNLMMKLKESYSVKSFTSASYHSSLICSSKVIRLDVNLIEGAFSTSADAFSVPNTSESRFGNVIIKNQQSSSCNDKKVENSEARFGEPSSVMNKASKSKKLKEAANTENSSKSSSADGKSKIKTSVNQQADQIQTKAEQTCSDFESLRCDLCLKYFSSKRNVKRHSILHGLKQHPCETCGKLFQTKENVKRHYRAVHEAKVNSIKCSSCYKAFSRKAELNIHLKKHPYHVQKSSVTLSTGD